MLCDWIHSWLTNSQLAVNKHSLHFFFEFTAEFTTTSWLWIQIMVYDRIHSRPTNSQLVVKKKHYLNLFFEFTAEYTTTSWLWIQIMVYDWIHSRRTNSQLAVQKQHYLNSFFRIHRWIHNYKLAVNSEYGVRSNSQPTYQLTAGCAEKNTI